MNPLYKKLGIKSDSEIVVLNCPQDYLDFFYDFPHSVIINEEITKNQIKFIHLFAQTRLELNNLFRTAKPALTRNGQLWISWPKKSSLLDTELNKFDILNHGLTNGLVDTKVVSINSDWSGLKFVYRLKYR